MRSMSETKNNFVVNRLDQKDTMSSLKLDSYFTYISCQIFKILTIDSHFEVIHARILLQRIV
jgi:hypothetical protein